MAGSTLPDRIAQIYYSYGLICSSFPYTAIILALSALLLCSYPLLNVPLPGNIPIVVKIPAFENFNTKYEYGDKMINCKDDINCENKKIESALQFKHLMNESQKLPYVWSKEKPHLYVQQIILKAGVSPWNSNLRMWDAFRGPIQEAFRLLETIRDHVDPDTKTTLSRICYQIDNIKRTDSKASIERVLPEYNCLLLSPANLWQQNMQSYSLDNNVVNTIFSYQNLHRGKVSIAEMAFGMNLKDAGIKRYPLRSRPRVLQFAVTIFYEREDERFINSLNKKLKSIYPLHEDNQYFVDEATLIYYPGKFNYNELIPLTITFIGLFIYIYFSVKKIEFIKSKLGIATCAVLSIGASLSMSMGLCLYFGFSLSVQIFPYLVIIVGLENVLVMTKSVTSTDGTLDFKIRLAQGLSREGWSITKNLLTEITIFTLSFFTFVPFIQEFSIFMIVSLVSDFFIQMVLFATLLGIDLRRMELFQEKNDKLHLKEYFNVNNSMNWQFNKRYFEEDRSAQRMTKSKSHPRLNGLSQGSPTDVLANRKSSTSNYEKVPKRVRLVNMWARTRFFQRAFMIWMLVWISMIVYDSGIVDYFVNSANKTDVKIDHMDNLHKKEYKPPVYQLFNYSFDRNAIVFPSLISTEGKDKSSGINETTLSLKHTQHIRPWSRLLPNHWSSILSQYNESLTGRYIVVLPPQLFSCRIGPEVAVSLRNPEEKDPPTLSWQALAAALDPIDLSGDFELIDSMNQVHPWSKTMSNDESPIYPTTPMEILLLTILCFISVIVIAYMMVVLYRCICSRNYAEWRASWSENDDQMTFAKQPAVQLVMQAMPLILPGHNHEIECVVSDGEKIVSSCLQGVIKIWDSQNGDLLDQIDRQAYFKSEKERRLQIQPVKKSPPSDTNEAGYTIDVVKSYENVPRLRKNLNNINFSTMLDEKKSLHLSPAENTKYNFARSYREFYCDQYNYQTSNGIHDNDAKTNTDSLGDFLSFSCSENISNCNRSQRLSDNNILVAEPSGEDIHSNIDWRKRIINESPIWCMDYCNDLIIIGCADGRLEFWEVTSCKLMCVWWNTHGTSRAACAITQVRAVGGARRVCVAALSGHLMMLRLDAYNPSSGVHVDWSFSTAHRRNHKRDHKRTGSTGSIYTQYYNDTSSVNRSHDMTFSNDDSQLFTGEEVHCNRVAILRAHQQPITEMHIDGGRILTGGQDHILKVFLTTDLSPQFTLHGHLGPITSCFIDHFTPTIGGSGSQDGLLCVWDLHTGACIYSIQAHDGAVTSLAYTTSYVISAGADERLCIWDRFQGHMLNSIHVGLNYMSRMLPLTHTLLLTGDRSGLTVYDISNGEIIRRVNLGQNESCIFVRQILPLRDAIVCDYANALCIVRFPLVTKLSDIKNE